jgi:hypothetical protein
MGFKVMKNVEVDLASIPDNPADFEQPDRVIIIPDDMDAVSAKMTMFSRGEPRVRVTLSDGSVVTMSWVPNGATEEEAFDEMEDNLELFKRWGKGQMWVKE